MTRDVPDTGEAQTALDLLRALLAGYAAVSDRPDLCDEAAALLDALRPLDDDTAPRAA
jgi:hypothetical protein